jgi:hypothetical protein
VSDFPATVSFDARFTCPPGMLGNLVDWIERQATASGFEVAYPPPDGLPWEHTLPIFEGITDEG